LLVDSPTVGYLTNRCCACMLLKHMAIAKWDDGTVHQNGDPWHAVEPLLLYY